MKRFSYFSCVAVVVLLVLVGLAEAKEARYVLEVPDQAICQGENAKMFLAANRPVKSFAITMVFYDPIDQKNVVPRIELPDLPKGWLAWIGIDLRTNEVSVGAEPTKGKRPLPPGEYRFTLNFRSFIGLLKPKVSGTVNGVEAEAEIGTIAILPPPPPTP